MSAARPRLPCLSTGSAAFDEILGGGLPVRSVNVIAGEPGAGKTIFALQMLFHQARQGKKGLYLTTLSEPALKLASYMQQFAFFDERLIAEKRVVIADLGSVMRRKGADETLSEIVGRVEQEEPAVVVIDSFKALRDLLGDAPALRTFNYDLAVHISSWGAASLLVGEYTREEMATFSEFAIADGIIRLGNRRDELRAIREVEVLKLRGADVVTGGHFFEITREGLAFFPRVRGPDDSIAEPEGLDARTPTGVAGLDDMLGGGLPRASATVVQGGTGTGKTMLGLQFLLEGARQGEPGIHFALEETANQLRRIAQGFGWDLAPAGTARAPHLPLRLSRRAVDRSLPARGAGRGGASGRAPGRARQLDQHGARRSLGAAVQRARIRHNETLPRRGRDYQHEHGDLRSARGGPAVGPRRLVRGRQRHPAEVRGGRRSSRTWHLRPEGARRAARDRRAPARSRRGPDRGHVGVRGPARRADRPAQAGDPRCDMNTRTLYDVTQLLESADQADARTRRVLELLRDLVPYEQCAMLEARLGHDPAVVLVPEPSPEARAVLARTLVDLFGQLVDPDARTLVVPGSGEARLAVPLVGLDEVIGILLVRSSVTEYSEEHLRALSVIAAKLAAYITIRGASADLADLARERDEARRAVEAARVAKDELLELLSAELKTPLRSTEDGAFDDLDKIQAQAQRLDDLLGQARLASAELRLTLRKVAPALAGEEPSSPGGLKRRGLG